MRARTTAVEHHRRQPTGLGVVAAAVVGIEQVKRPAAVACSAAWAKLRRRGLAAPRPAAPRRGRWRRARAPRRPPAGLRVRHSGKALQARISAGSGLLAGGRHFTALVMRQSGSAQPVVRGHRLRRGWQSRCACRVWYSRMPAWSPVNGRPVRLAPCSPGASPTISSRGRASPKGATGRQ